MLDWVAALAAKMQLGGISLSLLQTIDDGLATAGRVCKTSRDAVGAFQRLRRSTADQRDLDTAPKSYEISLGAPIPTITLVYTVTNYASVQLFPFTAGAAFRLGEVTISGLNCANLPIINPKNREPQKSGRCRHHPQSHVQ